MPHYHVSMDDGLGPRFEASSPEEAALRAAAELGLPPGAVVQVRWDVRLHPRDPSVWLVATLREVTLPGAAPSPTEEPGVAPEAATAAPAEAPQAAEVTPPADASPSEAGATGDAPDGEAKKAGRGRGRAKKEQDPAGA